MSTIPPSSGNQHYGQGDDSSPLLSTIADINQEFKERDVQQHARDLGISYIDVSIVPINDDLLHLVSRDDSEDGDLIPFFRVGKKLRIALVNPERGITKEILKKLENEGFILNLNLCSKESLKKAQQNYSRIKFSDHSVEELEKQVLQNVSNINDELNSISDLPSKFANVRSDMALALLHREVMAMKSSDLHLELGEEEMRVRGRVDGILHNFFTVSRKIAEGICRQIKFNAKIKSNVLNIPADGQYTFTVDGREIVVRVSVVPLQKNTESIVMRFLDSSGNLYSLQELGFLAEERKKIESALNAREGLILITGPTGSGKTTTLYSILKILNTEERKIITLEDPVEYRMEGIVQSSINPDEGYTFEAGLKALLRQDPDVILLGEVRDKKTAETALRASVTGHLVLSTLHTNSAFESLIRLKDLDIPGYLIASALKCIVAQRLVRKVCSNCAQDVDFSEDDKKQILNILKPLVAKGFPLPRFSGKLKKAVGCDQCSNTGYKGRTVISEVLPISKKVSDAISTDITPSEIEKILKKEGYWKFSYDAVIKLLAGEVSLEEVYRVLGNIFTIEN